MYFDLEGEVKGLNHKTGDTLAIKFHPKSWNSSSKITGKASDKNGKTKYEITGSYADNIYVKDL